jgi:UDP-2,4-diacetamido-2,4,6-trideoxy-beta-L-altropyranose hydrolase
MTLRRPSKVVFRADASLEIGTGHVMRCLTLANALANGGADCAFISGEHAGHLADLIRAHGYAIHLLPVPTVGYAAPVTPGSHAGWLATSWEEDAMRVRTLLADSPPDWLVLDHYAIDARWERSLTDVRKRLLVIDDLADRPHDCDLLLDQNLCRSIVDYEGLIVQPCQILAGPDYALLRPEFNKLRGVSLRRRQTVSGFSVLVTMGGVDVPNATGLVLETLKTIPLPPNARIDVVMGAHAPWLTSVVECARTMPWQTDVHVNPPSMARLMVSSDLAIGAAGTTALERCCLGLPSLQAVLADNQEKGAAALELAGAAMCIGRPEDISRTLPNLMPRVLNRGTLNAMSMAAFAVTDGGGATRVAAEMERIA